MTAPTQAQAAASTFVTGCIARGLTASMAAVPPEGKLEAVIELWAEVAQAVVDVSPPAAAPVRAARNALAEIDPGKLDNLADWLDLDDARKGRTGPPEVQADLRRWAHLVREDQLWNLSPDAAAPQPGSGEAAEMRAVIGMIWRMCQNPKQAAGTSQGLVVNGENLAARIAGLIKNSGMEPF